MKQIFAIIAAVALMASCSSGTGYKINGTVDVPELEGTYVYIQDIAVRDINKIDSVIITNGKFELEGDAANTVVRYIAFDPQVVGKMSTQIVLEPGAISVVADSESITVSGTKLNDALVAQNNSLSEKRNAVMEISKKFQASSQDGSMTPELEEELMEQYNSIQDEMTGSVVAFIKSNINNELGKFLFITNATALDLDVREEILALSDEEYKTRDGVKEIIESIENAKRVAVGQKFVDFTMKDTEGNSVSLSDYAGKGKYVLVDFWANWCGPCRQEMPNVVKAYKEFKDKGFEVVGVSLDRSQDEWEKGIADLDMTWVQMSDLGFWDSPVVGLYAIRGIPHTVLLDGEGTIIAKDLRGQELHEKLAELLN